MINIINISNQEIPKSNYFYCGRGSPVGNPYTMDVGITRTQVCNNYELWFNKELKDPDSKFSKYIGYMVALHKYYDITLGCYCFPKKCHCETIKNHVERINNFNLLGV
jgi:hypothetical protein